MLVLTDGQHCIFQDGEKDVKIVIENIFDDADNLAANFSRELADYIIYIIDVSGGDKIPRKGGPGITQADLLVCKKKLMRRFLNLDCSYLMIGLIFFF